MTARAADAEILRKQVRNLKNERRRRGHEYAENIAAVVAQRDELRLRLTAAEKVVEAARKHANLDEDMDPCDGNPCPLGPLVDGYEKAYFSDHKEGE
jgi:hypothetical protein